MTLLVKCIVFLLLLLVLFLMRGFLSENETPLLIKRRQPWVYTNSLRWENMNCRIHHLHYFSLVLSPDSVYVLVSKRTKKNHSNTRNRYSLDPNDSNDCWWELYFRIEDQQSPNPPDPFNLKLAILVSFQLHLTYFCNDTSLRSKRLMKIGRQQFTGT